MKRSSHDDQWWGIVSPPEEHVYGIVTTRDGPWVKFLDFPVDVMGGISDRRGLSILLAASRFRRNIIWAGLFLKPVKGV
jgi:hypothetical protein